MPRERPCAKYLAHTILSWFLLHAEEVWTELSCHSGHPSGLMWSPTAGTRGPWPCWLRIRGYSSGPWQRPRGSLCFCVWRLMRLASWLIATFVILFRTTKYWNVYAYWKKRQFVVFQKNCHVYIIKFYPFIKKKIMSFAGKWLQLEIKILNTWSQTWKRQICFLSFTDSRFYVDYTKMTYVIKNRIEPC